MSIPGWLSEYVEKISDFLVGTVVLRLMRVGMTPPAVSIPRERGATSSRRRSCIFSEVSPERIAAWTAAPQATASLGLMLSLPLKKSDTNFTIRGHGGLSRLVRGCCGKGLGTVLQNGRE